MIVGTAKVRLNLPEARTLKDKRRILNSLKENLRNRFNVSVAEIDGQDFIQSATIALAQVSNNSRHANSCLDKVVEAVRCSPAVRLVDYHVELF